jgi:hypothetical protein
VEAWSRKGFRLHDPSTWQRPEAVAVPDYKLVWTSDLLNVVPELASVAHTTADQAKLLSEKVLAFVQGRSELAESMVGRLLEQVGIKGRSRQKQHDVRKLLVERGLLVKQFNYFQDKVSGYRHGNFYVCGLAVSFEHEAKAARVFFAAPHPPRIYSHPSLDEEPDGFSPDDWLDLVMESRRLACTERYRERWRRLKTQLSIAA